MLPALLLQPCFLPPPASVTSHPMRTLKHSTFTALPRLLFPLPLFSFLEENLTFSCTQKAAGTTWKPPEYLSPRAPVSTQVSAPASDSAPSTWRARSVLMPWNILSPPRAPFSLSSSKRLVLSCTFSPLTLALRSQQKHVLGALVHQVILPSKCLWSSVPGPCKAQGQSSR